MECRQNLTLRSCSGGKLDLQKALGKIPYRIHLGQSIPWRESIFLDSSFTGPGTRTDVKWDENA